MKSKQTACTKSMVRKHTPTTTFLQRHFIFLYHTHAYVRSHQTCAVRPFILLCFIHRARFPFSVDSSRHDNSIFPHNSHHPRGIFARSRGYGHSLAPARTFDFSMPFNLRERKNSLTNVDCARRMHVSVDSRASFSRRKKL